MSDKSDHFYATLAKQVCKVPRCRSRATKTCIQCELPVCMHHSGGWPTGRPVCVKCRIEGGPDARDRRTLEQIQVNETMKRIERTTELDGWDWVGALVDAEQKEKS